VKIPEIDVQQLAAKLKSEQGFVLLDIRESWKMARATWHDPRLRLVPLSQSRYSQGYSYWLATATRLGGCGQFAWGN